MKQSALIPALVVCLDLSYPEQAHAAKYSKETPTDMSKARTIFLGWVDLPPESWSLWGYESKAEWMTIISDLNLDFQSSCKGQYLVGRTVTAAKSANDEAAAGNDLYIKFSDVNIDHSTYGIRLSIHFIDPRTNTEVASVPSQLYSEKRWFKFQLYLRAALDDIGKKIQAEVSSPAPKKK